MKFLGINLTICIRSIEENYKLNDRNQEEINREFMFINRKIQYCHDVSSIQIDL